MIEQLANSIREEFEIALPVTDVKKELERNGINVFFTKDMPSVRRGCDNNVSVYIWESGLKERENYLLARVLFFVLRMINNGEYGELDIFREDDCKGTADIFADNFLMPRLYFEDVVQGFTNSENMVDVVALSKHFVLTRQTVIGRGKDLGIFDKSY